MYAQNMSSEHAEVRHFLAMVLDKYQQGQQGGVSVWQGRWISNGLLGLRHMSTEHDVVLKAVTLLTDQLTAAMGAQKHSRGGGEGGGEVIMSVMDAALGLSGVQCISPQHLPLRRQAVSLLTSQLTQQQPHHQGGQQQQEQGGQRDHDLALEAALQCSHGLPGLHTAHEETRDLLFWLHTELKRVVEDPSASSDFDYESQTQSTALTGTGTVSRTYTEIESVLDLDSIRNIALGLSQVQGEALVPNEGRQDEG